MRSWICFLVLISCVTATAHADHRDASLQAFRRGSQHYKLGEYKEALAEFKSAFRHREDPSYLYNIAQCERQLGLREDAVREYKMFLAESADAARKDDARGMIARLEEEIAAERAAKDAAERAARADAERAAKADAERAAKADAERAAAAQHAQDLALTSTAPPPKAHTPGYKKWWVWTIVGVAAAGAAAGLAVGLTRNEAAPTANTALGTAHPFN
jgi:tetratricopeptide (TPR) repeat protein